MIGLSRHDLSVLDEDAHLAQSVADILTTPLGTRVMRRDYGSRLFDLIDAPLNGETVVDVFSATAEALDRWEPRLQLKRIEVLAVSAGLLDIRLEGETAERPIALEVTLGGDQ